MKTFTGNVYRIQVSVESAGVEDRSWIAGPISMAYPVDVMSIADASQSTAFVTVRWTGATGELVEGKVLKAPPLAQVGPGGTASVTIVSVEDLGAPPGASPGWPLPVKAIAAVSVLCITAALSCRVARVSERAQVAK